MTTLKDHYRGDTFRKTFTLSTGYVGTDFDSVKFTLRTRIPGEGVLDDSDAVDQASTDNGEITFVGAIGTIVIPDSRTTLWPVRKLFWDLQGKKSGSEPDVITIDSGEIPILGDVTRSV